MISDASNMTAEASSVAASSSADVAADTDAEKRQPDLSKFLPYLSISNTIGNVKNDMAFNNPEGMLEFIKVIWENANKRIYLQYLEDEQHLEYLADCFAKIASNAINSVVVQDVLLILGGVIDWSVYIFRKVTEEPYQGDKRVYQDNINRIKKLCFLIEKFISKLDDKQKKKLLGIGGKGETLMDLVRKFEILGTTWTLECLLTFALFGHEGVIGFGSIINQASQMLIAIDADKSVVYKIVDLLEHNRMYDAFEMFSKTDIFFNPSRWNINEEPSFVPNKFPSYCIQCISLEIYLQNNLDKTAVFCDAINKHLGWNFVTLGNQRTKLLTEAKKELQESGLKDDEKGLDQLNKKFQKLRNNTRQSDYDGVAGDVYSVIHDVLVPGSGAVRSCGIVRNYDGEVLYCKDASDFLNAGPGRGVPKNGAASAANKKPVAGDVRGFDVSKPVSGDPAIPVPDCGVVCNYDSAVLYSRSVPGFFDASGVAGGVNVAVSNAFSVFPVVLVPVSGISNPSSGVVRSCVASNSFFGTVSGRGIPIGTAPGAAP